MLSMFVVPSVMTATRSEVRGEAALEQVRDDQREENEGLDEGQTENHRRLDAGSRAGITGDTFECCGGSAALTEGATEDADADGQAGADADPAERIELVGCAFLRERHSGEKNHRGRDHGRQGKLALERHPDLLLSDHTPQRGLMLRMKNRLTHGARGTFRRVCPPRGPGRLCQRAPL